MAVLIRSTLFNIAFFGWVFTACVSLAWVALLPRPRLMATIRWFLGTVGWLERNILGLEYEIVGIEKLPREGSFILAAKHQSAWETMKLHTILNDPAVILKKELTEVPVWGLIARKARMIPVERGAGARAFASMLEGALRIREEGRPIAIFPQGTRVAPGAVVPYKAGVGLLYKRLNLPMIPMALNAGVFWPRKAYFKRPGRITVEILDPIPAGLPRDEAMARLEAVLEAASDRLVRKVGGPALPPRTETAPADAEA